MATTEEIRAQLAELVNDVAGVPVEDVQLDKSFVDDITTSSSGGYALAVPAGVYNVAGVGGTISGQVVHNGITVSNRNVKVDIITTDSVPVANVVTNGVGVVGLQDVSQVCRNGLFTVEVGSGIKRRQFVNLDSCAHLRFLSQSRRAASAFARRMSLFCVRLAPPASRTTRWPPRCVK